MSDETVSEVPAETTPAEPAAASTAPVAAQFVTFVHPDGRTLAAAVTHIHEDGSTVDLVVLEGETAPFGGTRAFVGVPYAEHQEGAEPIRGSWHHPQN